MLPGRSGFQVLRDIRARKPSLPVLILTAKDSLDERVAGLDAGADDYMAKPFALAELSARLRALLRRGAPRENVPAASPTSRWTRSGAAVRRAGRPIELKPKEYALLEFLMRNSDRPLTRSLIIEHVWDIHFDSVSNVVEVHINSLRNKIDRGFDASADPHRPRRRLHAHRHPAVMTLTLRTRLALISTAVVGGLLAGLGCASYRVLARRLDADVTARLDELTEGLHGYLVFESGTPSVRFDANDSDQAAFVHEATRYYQVYDAATGRLLVQSGGFAPLGAQLTAGEVREAGERPDAADLQTEYGRLRISNSVVRDRAGRTYLLQVGVSLAQTDRALARYRDLLLWGALPSLLVAALASWWLSGLALAPLRDWRPPPARST